MTKFLSITQAAAVLGISRQRLWCLLKANRFPAQRVGHQWLIRHEDLQAFIATRHNAGKAESL